MATNNKGRNVGFPEYGQDIDQTIVGYHKPLNDGYRTRWGVDPEVARNNAAMEEAVQNYLNSGYDAYHTFGEDIQRSGMNPEANAHNMQARANQAMKQWSGANTLYNEGKMQPPRSTEGMPVTKVNPYVRGYIPEHYTEVANMIEGAPDYVKDSPIVFTSENNKDYALYKAGKPRLVMNNVMTYDDNYEQNNRYHRYGQIPEVANYEYSRVPKEAPMKAELSDLEYTNLVNHVRGKGMPMFALGEDLGDRWVKNYDNLKDSTIYGGTPKYERTSSPYNGGNYIGRDNPPEFEPPKKNMKPLPQGTDGKMIYKEAIPVRKHARYIEREFFKRLSPRQQRRVLATVGALDNVQTVRGDDFYKPITKYKPQDLDFYILNRVDTRNDPRTFRGVDVKPVKEGSMKPLPKGAVLRESPLNEGTRPVTMVEGRVPQGNELTPSMAELDAVASGRPIDSRAVAEAKAQEYQTGVYTNPPPEGNVNSAANNNGRRPMVEQRPEGANKYYNAAKNRMMTAGMFNWAAPAVAAKQFLGTPEGNKMAMGLVGLTAANAVSRLMDMGMAYDAARGIAEELGNMGLVDFSSEEYQQSRMNQPE